MSARTFTVFQDTPSAPDAAVQRRPPINVLTASAVNSATSVTSLASTIEKENLHPLTGERTGPSLSEHKKKRKTSVLSVQEVHIPQKAKKEKSLKESTSKPASKKRKSSSTDASRSKASASKEGRNSSKKSGQRTSRKPPLPKVEEVAEVERERISQGDIDSRCYELTVRPLADLTQAYEQGETLEDAICNEKVKFRPVKESSAEPEFRDLFLSGSLSSSVITTYSKPSRDPSEEPSSYTTKCFSTPERKRIYSAFTFSSPSPSSQRFRTALTSTSPNRGSP